MKTERGEAMSSGTGKAFISKDLCKETQHSDTRELRRIASEAEARPRLLLIDPDLQVQELINEVFPPDSAEVTFEESLESWEKVVKDNSSLDVILMDLTNPVERCFELVSQLKDMCPPTEIILISRIADDYLWVESVQRGAYDLLPKPLHRNEVHRIVTNATQKSRATRRDEYHGIQHIESSREHCS